MDHFSEFTKTITNNIVTISNFMYNSIQIETLEIKKYLIEKEYNKKIKQNELFNELNEEKIHLSDLIQTIKNEISYYDMKIAQTHFENYNIIDKKNKILSNYYYIFDHLKKLHLSLQHEYYYLDNIKILTDEQMIVEHQKYLQMTNDIDQQIKILIDKKNNKPIQQTKDIEQNKNVELVEFNKK